MCLGVPGKVLTLEENALGMTMGTVSFGGVEKETCLAYVPEVRVGDYVIVHVGFAISIVSEEEAAETFEILRRMGELADLEDAAGPPGAGPADAQAPALPDHAGDPAPAPGAPPRGAGPRP
jgi:hydrogenase expression/formation protein HypC